MTHPATRRGCYSILLILAIALPHCPALAQAPAHPLSSAESTPQTSPHFEVVSIHPHHFTGDDPSDRRMLPGGRFVATATSVRTLIRVAFGTDDDRILGAPAWIDNEAFDINGTTADRVEITTPQQFQQLILSLLQERFAFKFHRGEKQGPIYRLEVNKPGKLGPALKPSTPASQPNMSTHRSASTVFVKVSDMAMTDVAAALTRQLGRPVEDHTGLPGKFDFEVQWAAEDSPDSPDPSAFTVLKDQLGLKLQPATGPIQTYVIDSIEHPSAN